MARRRHSNRRRRRGNFGFLYKLLSVLVICGAVVTALTLFFRVDTIRVTGTERYTEDEVIGASGIQLGDNLFLLNKYQQHRGLGGRGVPPGDDAFHAPDLLRATGPAQHAYQGHAGGRG